ncbi:MAG: ECF-type sigma factor [Puniceicoccaceae bacterium]
MKEQQLKSSREHDAQTREAARKVTRILNALEEHGNYSTNEVIPLVYTELRRVAAFQLSRERAGQTLQATALVNEAYLRLVQPEAKNWKNQRHFFRVAAEAMRRILIENSRRKQAVKRGGDMQKKTLQDWQWEQISTPSLPVDVHDLNEAIDDLCKTDPEAGELVKLRYFVGMTIAQIAETMEVSPRKADRIWAFSKAWLYRFMKSSSL